MHFSAHAITLFQETVWAHFAKHQRAMPWRENPDPYRVLVSEMMLQQTQVGRVIPKFNAFTRRFPDVQTLARAPLSEVLTLWSGLGYNRRAKFLHTSAQEIVANFGGQLPSQQKALVALPGVGPNTAGAIMAYAFNQPVVFVETNIRTVMIYTFFENHQSVAEKDILQAVQHTLDHTNPREWYWALMDYGTFLKETKGNNIARAKTYRKQSPFQGSRRQLRGKVLATLTGQTYQRQALLEVLNDPRAPEVLDALAREKLITNSHNRVQLTE